MKKIRYDALKALARPAILGKVRVKPRQLGENLQNLVRLNKDERGKAGVKNSIPVYKSNMVLRIDMGMWISNWVHIGIAWGALKILITGSHP